MASPPPVSPASPVFQATGAFAPGQSVADHFDKAARRDPAATALLAGARRVTYGDLDGLSRATVARLVTAGIGPGAVLIGLRPTHIARAGAQPPAAQVARLVVRADLIQPTGARAYVSFRLGGVEATTELEAREAPRLGEELAVDLDLDRAVLIDPKTDRVI